MKTNKRENKNFKATDFDEYLAKELKNKEAKKLFDEYGRQLEISYRILQLRKRKKMSQLVLAKKVGTTQSNIARLESGQQNFTIRFLDKVAAALDANLEINFNY
ncbi:MAG: helix-turn-helix transcriptional regulator [Patescibacteria group bacterium]|jgi:ribosome-binding protein aMBF1 (putative translation factor)